MICTGEVRHPANLSCSCTASAAGRGSGSRNRRALRRPAFARSPSICRAMEGGRPSIQWISMRSHAMWKRGSARSASIAPPNSMVPRQIGETLSPLRPRFRYSMMPSNFHRLELRRQDDLQHLAIVGKTQHRMLDARRLNPAGARTHHLFAFALELGFDPALEHVDHLEIDVVIVALGHLFGAERRYEPDHMGLHHAAGGVADAKIAVFRIRPQAHLEVLLVVMADGEPLLPSRLRARLRPLARPCGSLSPA